MHKDNEDMTDYSNQSKLPRFLRGRNGLALGGAGLLILGGAAGAMTLAATRPGVEMAPANPITIRSLASDSIVTVRGRVAETYGNKFILADATGRALIDAGRENNGSALVAPGQTVTVQGRFDDGFVHASFLVKPDGKVTALGPMGGPPRGPHGRRDGPAGADGPGRPDAPPPAPPAVSLAPPAPHLATSPTPTTAAPTAR
jgi:uncharacterized protein YdeI (BOF family)